MISALGGYLFGFDFAVISGTLPFLKIQFGMNVYQEGFTTASLALGCMIGCVAAGRLSTRYGRRKALMCAAVIFAVSSLLMAIAPTLSFLIAARFLAGIGVGMASMLGPMYIAEVSPAQYRGRLVSLNQLALVTGILVTNLVNYSLRNAGEDAWRWMFGLGAVPALLFFIGIIFLPESPRWLIRTGKTEEGKGILNKIGNSSFAEETFRSIQQSGAFQAKTSLSSLFKHPYRNAVIAGISLAVFQQFCGINVVFNYTSVIFESIGFSKDDQLLQTIFIGAVNLVFTLIAISLVDRIGRKPMMLTGAAGLAILYILIAASLQAGSLYTTIFLLAAIGLYASTIAPVTWVLISELFPNNIRDAATSLSVVCLWAAYFVLTFTFPLMAEWLGGVANTFYVYAGICVAGAFFITIKIKETKGKTLESMNQVFVH